MKAHLIDTYLLVPRSKSSPKVKVKYEGDVSQKMGVSGALVFHKHIMFFKALDMKAFVNTVGNGASAVDKFPFHKIYKTKTT